jgi:hypothetical protein
VRDAVAHSQGKYETEDVLALVLEYDYPLWIAFDGDDIKGAVITRFIDYPRKRYLSLEMCGGKDSAEWKKPMLDMLRNWAKDNKCAAIEAHGRVGWERVFRDEGYKSTLQSFELPLDIQE